MQFYSLTVDRETTMFSVMLCPQSLTNLPGEIGTQGEANRQTAVAVDVSYLAGNAYLPGHMDPECTPSSRADP
jgi:hypothetical protein